MTTIQTKAKIIFDVENRGKQALEKAGRQMGELERKTRSLQSTFKTMRNVGAIAFTGIATGLGFAVAEAAKLETLEVAFTTMIGSADKAKETIRGLRDFTAKTPFQFDGVAKASRQLLSFGVSSEDLQGKLKFLGDIAAGANIPLSDMAAIFGKSKAKGKAMTEELLQLSDRGVPIIAVLAKKMGVAESAIFDMASKGEISFDILQDSLMSMSEEGGIFFDLMTKMSDTVSGRFSTLKDNVQILAQSIGTQFLPMVADLLEKVIPLVVALGEWVEANPELTKKIIIATAVVTGFVAVVGGLAVGVWAVNSAMKTLGITTKALMSGSVWGLIIIGVIFLADKLKNLIAEFYGVELTWKEIWDDIIGHTSDAILAITGWIDKLVQKFNVVKFLFQDIKEKVTAGAIDLAGRVINVDDAIITPRGDIVQPADDDFIIATKDPSGLGGGQTINFDFSGATITNKEQFMNDIKMQLGRGVQLKGVGI